MYRQIQLLLVTMFVKLGLVLELEKSAISKILEFSTFRRTRGIQLNNNQHLLILFFSSSVFFSVTHVYQYVVLSVLISNYIFCKYLSDIII